jgi:hypothetical protein
MVFALACSSEEGDTQVDGTVDAGGDPGDPGDDTDAPPPIPACNTGAVPDPLTVSGVVENTIDGEVIQGATVVVRDSGESKLDELTTDVSGAYSFDLATAGLAWTGSFRVQAEGHLDTLVYPTSLNRNLADIPLPVLTPSQRDLGALLAGADIDESKGVIVAASLDCDNQGVAGVSYSFSGDVQVLYVSGDSVDANATATDESGIAIAFNIEPGTMTVTSTRGSQVTDLTVSTQANTITGAIYVP